MLDQILILVVLLFFSGFFSSAETALFSISKVKARHIGKMKGQTNLLIMRMKEDPHRLLATILIGNNLVNIGGSSLATAFALNLFPDKAVGIVTGVMTFLILVFGEILPKSIATRNNILISRIVIFPIFWLSILFYPLIKFLDFIPKLTGKIKKIPTGTEEELMTFVEVVEEEGEIKEEERELIHNIFEFDDTNAYEIMTPRADMYVIDVDEELRVEEIIKSGFFADSRHPGGHRPRGGNSEHQGSLHAANDLQRAPEYSGTDAPPVLRAGKQKTRFPAAPVQAP